MGFFDHNLFRPGVQARAVRAFFDQYSGIEKSWDKELGQYMAEPSIAEWHNCREEGYVVVLRAKGRQLNIAFFEHRNSDSICAVKWEESTLNPPTIESSLDAMNRQGVYRDKYEVSHSVGYGKVADMAQWIYQELEKFWVEATSVNP